MATTKAFELAQLSALTDVTTSDTTLSDELVIDAGSLTLDGGRNIQWGGAFGSGFPAVWGHSTNKQIKFAPDGNTSGMLYQMTATQLEVNPTTTSTTSTTGALVVAGGAGIAENLNVGGNIVVTGDLTVEGSQVTLNTTALDVEDKNITLNYHPSNDTSASASGAGITIQDAVDASTDASILWDASDDQFDFSHGVNISGNSNIAGNLDLAASTTEVRSLQIGHGRTGDGISLIDLVGDTTYSDYGFRVQRAGGENGKSSLLHHGTGNLEIRALEAATIRFKTTDSDRMHIKSGGDIHFYDSAGNVEMAWDASEGALGIGTNEPKAFLDVRVAQDTLTNVLANEIYAASFLSTDSGNTGHTTAIMLSGSSGTNRGVVIAAEAQSTGNDHDMIFATSASGSTPAEHVRITSDGKVGIGTSALSTGPASPLHIQANGIALRFDGTANTSRSIFFRNTTTANPAEIFADGSLRFRTEDANTDIIFNNNSTGTNNETMRITSDGRVGIGTNNPDVSLHIGDGTTDEFVIIDKGTSSTSGILLKNGGSNKVKLLSNSDEEFELHTNNTIKAKVTEAGTVYNYNNQTDIRPTVNWDFANSKRLDDVIRFYRNSRASYYDESGTIRYVGENEPRFNHDPLTRESKGLLLERSSSNLISNSVPNEVMNWTGTNAYMISNEAVAPDGTYSAVMIHDLATSGAQFHGVYKLFSVSSGTTYTYSIYLKKGDEDNAGMRIYDGAGMVCRATFNLANGTHTLHNGTSSSMTHVGNGWYHCIITGTASNTTSSADAYVFTTSVYTHTSTGDNSIYAWGAQIENKNFATSLMPDELTHTNRTSEGTYYDENGKLVTAPNGSPRYGYKWDERKWEETGLIIEPTSTNYVTYDLTHDNPKWYIAGSGATGGVSNPTDYFSTTQTAPDGSYTAVFLDASSAATPSLSAAYNIAASTGWGSATWSMFVKPYGTTDVYSMWIDNGSGTNGATAQFQISTMSSQGTRVNGGISIGNTWMERVGDGWYRLAMTCHDTIPQAQLRIYAADGVYGADEDGYGSATGSSTTSSRGSWFWGAQLEAVSSPTSYIHRIDGGATTTRSADIISVATPTRDIDIAEAMNVRHLIPSVEGTVYTEWDTNQPQGNFAGIFELLESGTNGIDHRITSSAVQYYISNNNSVAAGGLPTTGESNKSALAYDLTSTLDSETARNGTYTGVNTVHIWDLDLQHIRLGSIDFNPSYQLDGHIKSFKLYDKRLTGVEIQAMTEND